MPTEPSAVIDNLATQTIGAAIEVHRRLGPGFLESLYHNALCVELDHLGIPYRTEVSTRVTYRDRYIGDGRADIVVDERLLVEVKAVSTLRPVHRAQVMSYLKAMEMRLGLLMNFHTRLLKDGLHRIIWSPQ